MRILGLGFIVEALGLEDLVSRAWGLAFFSSVWKILKILDTRIISIKVAKVFCSEEKRETLETGDEKV